MPRSPAKKNSVATKEQAELGNRKLNLLEVQKLRLEEDKSWFEFHKHMTTLNTGVIIIIATLKKLEITLLLGPVNLASRTLLSPFG
jgi:hypothetical protein